MGKNKFYAVVKGRRPGIYDEWFGARGAEANVRGFAGARYKGFTSRGEAEAWFNELSAETRARQDRPAASRQVSSRRPEPVSKESPVQPNAADNESFLVYTDGGCSRNPGPGGYGVVVLYGDTR